MEGVGVGFGRINPPEPIRSSARLNEAPKKRSSARLGDARVGELRQEGNELHRSSVSTDSICSRPGSSQAAPPRGKPGFEIAARRIDTNHAVVLAQPGEIWAGSAG